MIKKILALAQAAALAAASAPPALLAQVREVPAAFEAPRTSPLSGGGIVSAAIAPPALRLTYAAAAPKLIVTPVVRVGLHAVPQPAAKAEADDAVDQSLIASLLEHGPKAGELAAQKGLGEASAGSERNFYEAAGLGRVREGAGSAAAALAEPEEERPTSLEKPLPLAGEYDYVVVGSGAGGAVVAAELAKKGFSVGVLEAGSGAEDPTNVVPSFHALASEAPGSAKFFVSQDTKLDKKNRNYVPPDKDGRGGIDKPRGWGLGGSPQVNAMFTMLPHPSEWQEVYELTGDPDWKPENMRRIWENSVEHNDGHPILKALDSLGRALRLKGLQNLQGYGFTGWLHVTQPSLAQASMILKDKQLSRIFFKTLKASAGRGGVANLLRRAAGGFDQNNPALAGREGFSITPLAVRRGTRSDPADYLQEVQRKCETGEYKGKIDLLTGALATKIQFAEGEPLRAVGVELLAGDHLYQADNQRSPLARGTPARVAAKREVILAAGVFNTPQLLMLSGVGPKEELTRAGIALKLDRPGVGANLQDRIEVGVVSRMKNPFSALKDLKFMTDPTKDPEFKRWLHANAGVYSTNGALAAVAFKSDPKLEKPDTYLFGLPGDFHGYYPGYSKDLEAHKDRFTWVVLHSHRGNRAGRLTLNASDPTKPPRVEMRAFDDPGAQADVEATAKAIEWIRLLNKKIGGQEELIPGPAVQTRAELAQWIKENMWGHHPVGTSPMGAAGDPKAVVDGDFKVIGTRGLRVVDASAVGAIPGLFPVAHFYTMAALAARKISADAEPSDRTGEAKPLWTKDRRPAVSQDIALIRQIYDAFWGDNNGIPDEKDGPGTFWRLQDALAKIPLIRDLPGVKDWDSPRMRDFMKALSSPVRLSRVALEAIPPSYREFYKMMKAAQAHSTGHPVDKISEGVVKAEDIAVTDPVTGEKTRASHEIFYQRWDPPEGAAQKDIVVISPAYQATGRQWTRIAAALAARGNTVLVMDNEYAGLSKGAAGNFTGDSLAAGIALMLSHAEELRQSEGLSGQVRVLGESLSAGAAYSGVLEAYNGFIDLKGRALPKDGVYVAMVNPYLGKIVPPLLQTVGAISTRLRLPVPPIPTIDRFTNVYKDADARKRFNALARLEDIRVHPSGLAGAVNHLQHALRAAADGRLKIPSNVSFGLLRTTNDQSIDRSQTDWLERQAGASLSYVKRIPDLPDHALALNDKLQEDIVLLAAAGQEAAPKVDPAPAVQEEPGASGIRFKETLHGGFALGATDPASGAASGRDTPLTLRLAVETPDMKGFRADPDHALRIRGTLDFSPFGARMIPVEGKLQLLSNGSGKIVMAYALGLEINGKPYTLVGKKLQQAGFHPYRDTTVLFTELHEGGPDGALAGAGVLKLGPLDVANLAASFRGLGGKGLLGKAATVARFGRFFLDGLFARYVLGQD